jgi:hypothetical protein
MGSQFDTRTKNSDCPVLGNLTFWHKVENDGMGTFGNVTSPDNSVITANVSYTFTDLDSANQYLSFISNLNPTSATIVSQ